MLLLQFVLFLSRNDEGATVHLTRHSLLSTQSTTSHGKVDQHPTDIDDGSQHFKPKQEVHQLVGRQNAAALGFDPTPSEAAFSTVFRSSFRPEVYNDVISGVAVEPTGLEVRVKFGDFRSNRSPDI